MKIHRVFPTPLNQSLRCGSLMTVAFGLSTAAWLGGCANAPSPRAPPSSPSRAVAELKPTAGHAAAGSVWFTQDRDGIAVTTQIHGLAPNQEHGFHVHEKGDCSAADASSAGGHLNPTSKPHGPQDRDHHAGDLPSLKADASGNARMRFSVRGTLTGSGASDLVGKALVVHANRDDYSTQPDGQSGPRIACGAILIPTNQTVPGAPKGVPNEM